MQHCDLRNVQEKFIFDHEKHELHEILEKECLNFFRVFRVVRVFRGQKYFCYLEGGVMHL